MQSVFAQIRPLTAAAALAGLWTAAAHAQATSAAPGAASASPPGASGLPTVQPRQQSIDELLRRLDTLEDRNKELEKRVSDLSQQQGEAWIGEQRAAQVREIVSDVLADSQARASLQGGGMTAGWNDGFFLASMDGRFRLNIGGLIQTRLTYSNIRAGDYNATAPAGQQFIFDRKDDRYGFGLPEVQMWMDGHLFSPDFQYMIKARFFQQIATNIGKGSTGAVPGEADFSGFELMDAWIRMNLDDNWSMRVGQFRTPYSRGFLVQEQYQMSTAPSVVDYHYALGYTQGIEMQYVNDEVRARTSFNNGDEDNLLGDANSFTGDNLYKIYPTGSLGPMNSPWWMQNSDFSMTGRLEWKPAGAWNDFKSYTSPAGQTFGLLTGLGIHFQQSRPYQPNANTPTLAQAKQSQWVAVTTDAQANFGGASLNGSFFWNYVESPAAIVPALGTPQPPTGVLPLGNLNILAFQLQGAFYFMPKWELFARYEFAFITGLNDQRIRLGAPGVPPNPSLEGPPAMNLITFGLNYYIDGQDLKWTTDFGWAPTAVHPWFADIPGGWRPSRSDEMVFRTQLQLMF